MRTFEDYARVDFALGDNDPVYFAVVRARDEWGHHWASRFCVGMLSYYHMGTAVKAADLEGPEFWKYLYHVYDTAPRGAARRHFRGAAGLKALEFMERFAPEPSTFFQRMPLNYNGIKAKCESYLPQFGPYFWLKIADYMDRCLGTLIKSYDGLGKNLSKVPGKAARVLFPSATSEDQAFNMACELLTGKGLLAPPLYDREVGPAEVETILCDWLHAKQGTNWLGADLIIKREALEGYGPKARRMSDWLPPVVDKDTFKLELE